MSRKTEQCYKHLFETLREYFPLNGKSVMTDFELALRNAIRAVYPEIETNTCWFHFCQAAKRKASQISPFTNAMKKNDILKDAYYKMLALPLLPEENIVQCFQIIKSQIADVKVVKPFIKYYENQWIKKVSIKDNFLFIHFFLFS